VIEVDIKDIIKYLSGDPTNEGAMVSLRQLEFERNEILRKEEEQWCLRSRALWLFNGEKTPNISIIMQDTIDLGNISGKSKGAKTNLSWTMTPLRMKQCIILRISTGLRLH
jgi:hypothetical protein